MLTTNGTQHIQVKWIVIGGWMRADCTVLYLDHYVSLKYSEIDGVLKC